MTGPAYADGDRVQRVLNGITYPGTVHRDQYDGEHGPLAYVKFDFGGACSVPVALLERIPRAEGGVIPDTGRPVGGPCPPVMHAPSAEATST